MNSGLYFGDNMAQRYFCLDEKYMIPDPEWSWQNNGSSQCYVKADDYSALQREVNELRQTVRYLELSENTK